MAMMSPNPEAGAAQATTDGTQTLDLVLCGKLNTHLRELLLWLTAGTGP